MEMELSILEFAALAGEMIVAVDHKKHESLEHGAKIIEKEAKRVIGTYDYGWPSWRNPLRISAPVSATNQTSRCCAPAPCAIRSSIR